MGWDIDGLAASGLTFYPESSLKARHERLEHLRQCETEPLTYLYSE